MRPGRRQGAPRSPGRRRRPARNPIKHFLGALRMPIVLVRAQGESYRLERGDVPGFLRRLATADRAALSGGAPIPIGPVELAPFEPCGVVALADATSSEFELLAAAGLHPAAAVRHADRRDLWFRLARAADVQQFPNPGLIMVVAARLLHGIAGRPTAPVAHWQQGGVLPGSQGAVADDIRGDIAIGAEALMQRAVALYAQQLKAWSELYRTGLTAIDVLFAVADARGHPAGAPQHPQELYRMLRDAARAYGLGEGMGEGEAGPRVDAAIATLAFGAGAKSDRVRQIIRASRAWRPLPWKPQNIRPAATPDERRQQRRLLQAMEARYLRDAVEYGLAASVRTVNRAFDRYSTLSEEQMPLDAQVERSLEDEIEAGADGAPAPAGTAGAR